ncbi:endonuclease NucS [Trueperella pyogenes]|uniref:endonuclease NucS n=1 Tax=Trueperella pyogenes TaxID=1661 RepID=UPI000D259BA5|nr:endonuclease NucS [Trueperella pyogenes]AWA44365.1 endonuclease NucS [Trueperella pyogenes]UVJ54241.1 endonuclease NucS [Trueperella pyogenes]UVJ56247.1 endonuclease NucS [Trueperella pyogenes]WHU58988.1 endonuclease NucS [Trueperella pyogenes]
MRIVIATCSVDYSGRLDAHLEPAKRVLMLKSDGSVLVHADGGSYKPLNWMSPPCSMRVEEPDQAEAELGIVENWRVEHAKMDDALIIHIHDIHEDISTDLGIEPGLLKDGVEAHLQRLLAEQTEILGAGTRLVRREYPTAIGPVDLLVTDSEGRHIAVEVKRRGGVDGVEQLTRYLSLLERDSTLRPIRGIFAAQEIKPQARVLAEDRGIECIVLDYDAMRGVDRPEDRLF